MGNFQSSQGFSLLNALTLVFLFLTSKAFAVSEETQRTIDAISGVDSTYQIFFGPAGRCQALMGQVKRVLVTMREKRRGMEKSIKDASLPSSFNIKYADIEESFDEINLLSSQILRAYKQISDARPRFEIFLKKSKDLCQPGFGEEKDETDYEFPLSAEQKIMIYSLEFLGSMEPMLEDFKLAYSRMLGSYDRFHLLENEIDLRLAVFREDLSKFLRRKAVVLSRNPVQDRVVSLPKIGARRGVIGGR